MTVRLSITTKLSLAFLGLLVLVLGLLGTVSTLWFVHQQSLNLDQFLDAEQRAVANRLEGIAESFRFLVRVSSAEVDEALRRSLRDMLSSRINRPIPYKTTLLIVDAQGLPLAESNHALDLTGPLPALAPGETRIDDVRGRGPAYRVVTASVSLGPGRLGAFRIGCLLSSLDAPLQSFLVSLLVALGGSLVLFSGLGLGLIRLTLRPVRSMVLVASQISEQNLGTRIPLPPGDDNLSRLARTLNSLLARLETDYQFQERLVSDLTHQLKTPLTILRGRNELALNRHESAQGLEELVEDNLSDIDGLVNLLNTLLELARYDSRIDKLKTAHVDLGALVAQLGEDLEPLWLSKNLQFVPQGDPAVVQADAEGLRQILTNLYDNCWKFSPVGSPIVTSWRPLDSWVEVVVSNQGPPIPDDDLEKIFKRFYRSAAVDPPSGSGLGLSIVRSLVELHGGSVRAFNPPGGGAAFAFTLLRVEPVS